MLASVLHSPSAVQMSVMVMRAFIAMRQAIATMLSVDHHFADVSKTIPENLPPAEDVRKVERRLASEEKKMLKNKKK